MIEVKNLKKHYTVVDKKGLFKKEVKTVNAVNGVSINIEKGKITGLIGINGAGKTTIIKTLSTIISADEGTILVDGLDIDKDEDIIKTKLNIITSGDRGLYWQLTARENLTYFGELYEIPKKELAQRVEELIKFVGLEDKADDTIERYSKGMKQRLQIARGLINNPEYVLMDEPTVGLDINIAKVLRNKVKELVKEQNKGILLTTHYISEIEELCDYVYIINKGTILYEGTTGDIIKAIDKDDVRYEIEVESCTQTLQCELEKTLIDCLDVQFETDIKVPKIKVSASKNVTKTLLDVILKHTDIISFSTIEPRLEDAILKFMESNNNG